MIGTCRYCGAVFTAQRSDAKYCSSRCSSAWHKSKRPAPKHPNTPPHIPDAEITNYECLAHVLVSLEGCRSSLDYILRRSEEPRVRLICGRLSKAIADAIEKEGL